MQTEARSTSKEILFLKKPHFVISASKGSGVKCQHVTYLFEQ